MLGWIRKNRFARNILLVGLCLVCAAVPARADQNAQVEALRQLYRELNLAELPADVQCDNGDGCGHVYIDADGQVKALCPFGAYMLGFSQPRLMSTRPIELTLKPGNNLIDRGTTYMATGGYSDTTVTVAQLRSVVLALTNANINELVLSAGSTAAVRFVSNSHVGVVKPASATLTATGSQAFDQLGESAANPGSVTLTGAGVTTVGSLFSVLSAASNGSVTLRAGALTAVAVANWQTLTLAVGSFDAVTSLYYNGTLYPLCIQTGGGATTGYSPLPVPESGNTYEAVLQPGDNTICNVTLRNAPAELTIDSTGGSLAVSHKCVLKSAANANQNVEIQTGAMIEMVSARTTGALSVDGGVSAKARFNGGNSFNGLAVPAGASLALSGGGSLYLGSVTNDGTLTISNGPGVVEASALTGSGTVTVDGQTNFALPSVPSLNNGQLLPTRIRIVESGGVVKNTKIQLKLGTGELFTTTTDGNGLVTLWRAQRLTQVDVVALSGSDTYTAVIVGGNADADALPVIQSVTLDRTGSVVINATGAKSYGVQYVLGSQTAEIKDAFDVGARRVAAPDGKCVIPGLRDGDQITIRAYAAKEENVALTAATSDAFAFSAKQGIGITSKVPYILGTQKKTYDGYPFTFNKKFLPTKYLPIEYWYMGTKLKSEPVNEGEYIAVLTILPDDPVYLPKTYYVNVEISRRRIMVYTFGTYKQKHEEDPEIPFDTDPLVGDDMVMGFISRSKGESYGNHAYFVNTLYAEDIDGKRVDHYNFVLAPGGGCMFIDWNFRHYIPVDPLSYIDPVYEEAIFTDGSRLRIQYRTSAVLNLDGTYMGTLVRDSDTRQARPYTPSLRVRQGYDEALLVLTADAEFHKDGGYETDRDGNRVWRGRVLSLSYWQINQLRRRHIQYLALSLKGSALMVSLGDLMTPEMEGVIAANQLKKNGLRFNFELIPTLGQDALRDGEAAAKPLFAGRSPLMRMEAYLEYDNRRVDLSGALPNAWLLFDASPLLEGNAAAPSGADPDVVETVNGRPVNEQSATELTPEESAAAQGLIGDMDTTDQQRELAYTLLERAIVRNGGALQQFRENRDDALDSDIVVPYTASETRIMEFAALMRTRPFFIASFRQNGLYGLKIP